MDKELQVDRIRFASFDAERRFFTDERKSGSQFEARLDEETALELQRDETVESFFRRSFEDENATIAVERATQAETFKSGVDVAKFELEFRFFADRSSQLRFEIELELVGRADFGEV